MHSRRSAALATLTLLLALLSTSAAADTRYISDRLSVPLRSGPTNGHRIINFLPAGTQLEVLESDADTKYSRIRTARGTEGWLEARNLAQQPGARQRLSAAEAEIRQLQQRLDSERSKAAELANSKGSAEATSNQLQAQLESITGELEALQAISSNAVAEHAENQKLSALNVRLRSEVQGLAAERDRLEQREQQRIFLFGAGLVIAGLLLGVLIKARPRRSAWT
ncbi:MAG: TIGR04211 family SH3 domain-containing protein [Pseudomonadota bacterium]